MKNEIIRVTRAGCYSGEYNRSVAKTRKQDMEWWAEALRSKGLDSFTVATGYFRFGKYDPVDGAFVEMDRLEVGAR